MRHEKLGLIFSSIYRHRAVSRDELARETSVSPASISGLTSSLLSSGVLRISGERPSRGGRRAELLELNPGSRFLVGVDLQSRFLRLALTGLSGEIHRSGGGTIENTGLTFNQFLTELKTFLGGMSEAQGDSSLAIGISTPELIDRRAATMISSNRIAWLGVAVTEIVARETGLPTYLARSGDAAVLGEKWFGVAKTVDHSIVITLGGGVGCGLLLENQLYSGASLLAGEFGHMTANPDGPRCYCGKRGCLEGYVSESKLVENFLSAADRPAGADFRLRDLCSLARGGDPVAQAQIQLAGRYLGIGISDLIQLLNPEQVVLAGALADDYDVFLPEIEATIAKFTMPMLSASTRLVSSLLGAEIGVKGAAAFALHQLINSADGIDRIINLGRGAAEPAIYSS